ncbi:DUF1796 family putative cysteine peptidase [Paenibacillus rigui]|uniref:Peptidase n=1 Tax=Paenibacillus rigui TaxID=554312 RepID=A0A229UVE4_9BACL|nr:DUF1796 family putative cysteine peptidase [Paenibacillus rigui]OXM87388.1 peptidase [Paenibacillus rigui]
MKLEEINGCYDAIFSLGSKCLASIQLRKNQLRPYSGVLDWMLSPSLQHVNLLLRNRFTSFLDYKHLALQPNAGNMLYRDVFYNITLAHDMPLKQNVHDLTCYPELRRKMDRRIQRFLEKCDTCPKILFIRLGGTWEEVLELQQVLSGLVTHDFRILLVNHSTTYQIIDTGCSLEKVCSIQIPLELECDDLWRIILHRFQLVSEL